MWYLSLGLQLSVVISSLFSVVLRSFYFFVSLGDFSAFRSVSMACRLNKNFRYLQSAIKKLTDFIYTKV